MNTYEVVLAITSYAYIEIEATDPIEAMRTGAEEWESYKHEADNPSRTTRRGQPVAYAVSVGGIRQESRRWSPV